MARSPAEEKRDVQGRAMAARVVAPARLHFGFLDLHGGLGRRYGSLGLAIDTPVTELIVREARSFSAHGTEATRADDALRRLAKALNLDRSYAAEVKQAIPSHAGLGSGTQLALAIGAALARLNGLPETGRALGEMVDRGARSAIGIAAFDEGGFIVDGGRGPDDGAPPVLARHPFPESWRVLLVLDPKGVGVHGDKEASAFASLEPFSDREAGHLCRLVLMRLLPGLVERDLTAFGAAISEIQAIVGEHFAAAQGGGLWSSPAVGRAVERLEAAGAAGIGQSSWGPTGFAFAPSEDAARRLYQSTAEAARGEGLEVLITRGRNSGARVELHETADLDI